MTNKELLKENAFVKQRIQELEQSESEREQAEKNCCGFPASFSILMVLDFGI